MTEREARTFDGSRSFPVERPRESESAVVGTTRNSHPSADLADPSTDPTGSVRGTPTAILIGPPGAGKSTVGPLLAALLGVGFTDTDSWVEASAGKPVSDIFIQDGEAAFRALERAAVASAIAAHRWAAVRFSIWVPGLCWMVSRSSTSRQASPMRLNGSGWTSRARC
jgi:hypothetical protein